MLRLLLISISFFISTTLFAQNKFESTNLDELIITSKKKKKIKKYKLSGFPPDFIELNKDEFIVTNFENLPKGKIISTTFYFNTWLPKFANSLNDEFKLNYTDIELGILLFKMKENGTLGDLISDSEITFVVKKEHRNDIKIDVSSLAFPEKFFLGFKVLNDTEAKEGNFYASTCEPKLNFSYQKFIYPTFQNSKIFKEKIEHQPFALRTTLEIEQ